MVFSKFTEKEALYLKTLQEKTNKLVVGVYDDWSLRNVMRLKAGEYQLLIERMNLVKEYVDQVFVMTDIDPTPFLRMIHDTDPRLKQLFVYPGTTDDRFFLGSEYLWKTIDINYICPDYVYLEENEKKIENE